MKLSVPNMLSVLAFGYSIAQTTGTDQTITLSPEERQMMRQMPITSLRMLPFRLIAALNGEDGVGMGNIPGAAVGPAVIDPQTQGASGTTGGIVLPECRIATDAVPEDFDSPSSPFKIDVVKGIGVDFRDVVTFPAVTPSNFDKETVTKAFGLSIDDESVFFPGGNNFVPEDNLRRVDLMPANRMIGNDTATTGIRAVHLSLMPDASRPLNLTHQYTFSQLETAAFDANQVTLVAGGSYGSNYTVLGRSQTGTDSPVLYQMPITSGWTNFGLLMDFGNNTIQVFASTGGDSLTQRTEVMASNLTGNGEYHFGLIKSNIGNAPHPNITAPEGFIFGGIFMEPDIMRVAPNSTNA